MEEASCGHVMWKDVERVRGCGSGGILRWKRGRQEWGGRGGRSPEI